MQERSPLLSWKTLGWAMALFVLNALVCRELFFLEYSKFLGSIEAAYIGISRYAIAHPFEWDWFPLWYGGVPYHNTYPPLLHLIVAAVAWLAGISPALSHHAVTAAFYALGPVTLYLLVLELSRKRGASLLAALACSLFSPAPVLASSLRAWAGTPLWPTRLQALLVYGDGPHIASVTLLPVAILALHWAVERRRPWPVFGAAAALAAVALTNWLGAFALAIMAAAYLLVRSQERDWTKLVLWSGLTGAIAYGLAVVWIPPSNIRDIRHNAQHTIGHFPMTANHILYGACVAAAVALLWWVYRRWKPTLVVAYSGLLTLIFGALVLTDDWLGIQLMPQPHRYHHELEMTLCVLAVFGAARLTERLPVKSERRTVVVAALLFCVVQYRNYRVKAREMLEPIDMTQTVDYQASKWLGERFPNERVFISGSIQFWLNAFADTPQLGGGFGQGIVNRTIPAVHFGVPFTADDGQAAAMWLRLYGVQAVVVNAPGSRDFYNGVWRDPAKFDGVLPEIWRDGGDVIYAVPQRTRSLAHVILPEHAPFRTPENNLDIAPVEALAKALEDPTLPLADLEWVTQSDVRITADLQADHLLFVQITGHPGWRAFVNGEPRRILVDPLGFTIVEPKCTGPCEVTLTFDGGMEMLLARLACGLTILGMLVWRLAHGRRAAIAPARREQS